MIQWIKFERIPGLLASAYEKASRLVVAGYYSQVADEIVAGFKSGLMLDLGTGPGYLPIEIVKRAPEIKIIGIDLSRRLIQMARENAAGAGLTNQLSFEIGNAARLRFDDAAFDMVISTGMLHSLKKPVLVFQEIYRLLKTGGRAWIWDPANVTDYIDREKWKASLSMRERFFLWLFKLIRLHKPPATYERNQVVAMIKDIGFEHYRIDAIGKEIRIKLRK